MFRWRQKRESPSGQRQRRILILRETLTLVRTANEAESESTRHGSLESTSPRELARSRVVSNAQRVLIEQIRRGLESGMTLEDITSEVIEPVIQESVVGDVARFAIDEALRRTSGKGEAR